jgi:hypothetical protein
MGIAVALRCLVAGPRLKVRNPALMVAYGFIGET